jgi:transcriptional regulator GlxA family with amidase domain
MLVIMTRALLVIDVQESFRQRPLWRAISNPGIATDVARLVDGARARGDLVVWVAREMVVYARRNGDEQQASAMLRHRNHLSDTAHRAQDHIEARFASPLPLAEIARRCGVSERTLTRRFTAATGVTPLRHQQLCGWNGPST